MKGIDLAILYWFYEKPQITKNHLKLIRQNNPDIKIYGLFGGNPKEAQQYKRLLSNLLDDFWTYPGTYGNDRVQKWIYGDLLILDWYEKQGRSLKWDSISVLQWDMLLFTDIKSIVPDIKKGQVFFSGYRKLNKALEDRWSWTTTRYAYRKDYMDFRDFLKEDYKYTKRLDCCLYIYEILTRPFFEAYLKLPNKKIGMLEYKDPTICNVFGIDIYEYDVGVYWRERGTHKKYPMNALSSPIEKRYIDKELNKTNGWRMFHPYKKRWD